MSVCHVVTFTFKTGTSEGAIAKLAAALDVLASHSGAAHYRHGRDLQRRDGNADYAVTALFEDYECFSDYLASPEHLGIVADLLTPHLERRSAVQFEV